MSSRTIIVALAVAIAVAEAKRSLLAQVAAQTTGPCAGGSHLDANAQCVGLSRRLADPCQGGDGRLAHRRQGFLGLLVVCFLAGNRLLRVIRLLGHVLVAADKALERGTLEDRGDLGAFDGARRVSGFRASRGVAQRPRQERAKILERRGLRRRPRGCLETGVSGTNSTVPARSFARFACGLNSLSCSSAASACAPLKRASSRLPLSDLMSMSVLTTNVRGMIRPPRFRFTHAQSHANWPSLMNGQASCTDVERVPRRRRPAPEDMPRSVMLPSNVAAWVARMSIETSPPSTRLALTMTIGVASRDRDLAVETRSTRLSLNRHRRGAYVPPQEVAAGVQHVAEHAPSAVAGRPPRRRPSVTTYARPAPSTRVRGSSSRTVVRLPTRDSGWAVVSTPTGPPVRRCCPAWTERRPVATWLSATSNSRSGAQQHDAGGEPGEVAGRRDLGHFVAADARAHDAEREDSGAQRRLHRLHAERADGIAGDGRALGPRHADADHHRRCRLRAPADVAHMVVLDRDRAALGVFGRTMPLPQSSTMLSLTIRSRFGAAIRMPAGPKPADLVGEDLALVGAVRVEPGRERDPRRAGRALRVGAELTQLVALDPERRRRRSGCRCPRCSSCCRRSSSTRPRAPRPSALMAPWRQPTTSLPVIRVPSRCRTLPARTTAWRSHQNMLSSIAQRRREQEVERWLVAVRRTAVGSLARMPIGAKITLSRITAPPPARSAIAAPCASALPTPRSGAAAAPARNRAHDDRRIAGRARASPGSRSPPPCRLQREGAAGRRPGPWPRPGRGCAPNAVVEPHRLAQRILARCRGRRCRRFRAPGSPRPGS